MSRSLRAPRAGGPGLASSVGLCMAVVLAWSASIAAGAQVDVTKFGSPVWQPVDFHFVAADVGNGANGYAEFFTLSQQILPEPNHKNYPNVGIGPGAPHGPPYDREIGDGLASLGLQDRTSFPVSDFSNGRAVILTFMVVADGTETGSSPEFASGPIIPNDVFPITFELADKKNGQDFSEPGSFPVPSHTTLDPAFANLEGTSHFPFFLFENADFAKDPSAPLAGNYQFEVKLTDAGGNGYNLTAPFTITAAPPAIPLPAADWPGLALLTSLGSLPLVRKLRGVQ